MYRDVLLSFLSCSNLLSFFFDVTIGRMNRAPNETRTHSCRFTSQPC